MSDLKDSLLNQGYNEKSFIKLQDFVDTLNTVDSFQRFHEICTFLENEELTKSLLPKEIDKLASNITNEWEKDGLACLDGNTLLPEDEIENLNNEIAKLKQENFELKNEMQTIHADIIESCNILQQKMNNYINIPVDDIGSGVKSTVSAFVEYYDEKEDDSQILNTYRRQKLAMQGRPENLDVLVHDEDVYVRREVAKHGRPQDLDILINDKDNSIRNIIAKHGRPQDLDILVHDSDWQVRVEVARHGRPQDLDILVHDEAEYVRGIVANVGRSQDLDILVNDENPYVRGEVAKHGRPQDAHILINDENKYVRNIAQRTLEKQQSEPSLDSEAKDMSAAKDAQDTPVAGHDKDKGVI